MFVYMYVYTYLYLYAHTHIYIHIYARVGRRAVESTEGASHILPGREFSRWAPSPFGVTVSFT